MSSILKVDTIQNTGGTTGLTIDSSGRVSLNVIPYFLAQSVHTDTTFTNQVVPYANVIENDGNCYSTSDNTFTAPITGLYSFTYSVNGITSSADRVYIQRAQDGSNFFNIDSRSGQTTTNGIHTRGSEDVASYDQTVLTIPLKVNANGKVRIRVSAGSIRNFHANFFSGYLIG